jgi:hypothetical protein
LTSNCSANQEAPSVLWKLNIHYHVHKFLLMVSVVRRRIQSTNIHPIFFLRFNLILFCDQRLGVAGAVYPSGWKQLNAVCISLLSHAYYMTNASHSLQFYHSNGFWSKIMNRFIMQFPLACCCVLPVRSKYFPQRPVFWHPQPMYFLSVREQISHVCKIAVKFVACGVLRCFRSYIVTE